MKLWAWIKQVLDLDKFDRLNALERRMSDDHNATKGAVAAFKKFAGEAKR